MPNDRPADSDVSKPWSKKVTKRRRRSAVNDRKVIARTRVSAPLAVLPAVAPSVSSPSPAYLPTPANDDHKAPSDTHGVLPVSDARKVAEKSATTAKSHAYEHTTDLGKITSAYRVLEATGAGVAFTLNCSPDEIAAAQHHPRGFADYFKRRISRALKGAFDYAPLYGFGVDVAPDNRLHIHGAIAANDNQLAVIKGALCHAGGKWASPWHRDKQCKLKPLCPADGWAIYCLRNQARVRRIITGGTISITTPLRRRARELWSVLRAART